MAFIWPTKKTPVIDVAKPTTRLEQLEVFQEVFRVYSAAMFDLVSYGPIGANETKVSELREAAKFAYLPVKEFVEPYIRSAQNPLDHLIFGITEAWTATILDQKVILAEEALGTYSEHLRYLISKSQ